MGELSKLPNIGKTVGYEAYQLDVERAEQAPATRNDILAKRFGLPMEGYTYYFTYEETIPHDKIECWGLPCALGADLSQGDDFCAFTFFFPLKDGRIGIKTRSYISRATFDKLPGAMRLKYEDFLREGSLIIMEGITLNIDQEVYDDLDGKLGYDSVPYQDMMQRPEGESYYTGNVIAHYIEEWLESN